jgi:hypothetical protein
MIPAHMIEETGQQSIRALKKPGAGYGFVSSSAKPLKSRITVVR